MAIRQIRRAAAGCGRGREVRRPLSAIKYGTRARIGMIIPSANLVAEAQIAAMLPDGVSLHTTRLRLGKSEDEKLAMLERLEEAVDALADAQVDRIVFHCTAVAMWDAGRATEIAERIRARTTIPAIVSSESIFAALATFGAERIVLVTPYPPATNAREVARLAERGVAVVREWSSVLYGGVAMFAVPPVFWRDAVLAARETSADAYLLSCTAIRSVEVIAELERELDRPVITSNGAMAWHALRHAGITDTVAGFGRLFDR